MDERVAAFRQPARNRRGTVDDLVGTAPFPAAPAAASVTAATLTVDGRSVVAGLRRPARDPAAHRPR